MGEWKCIEEQGTGCGWCGANLCTCSQGGDETEVVRLFLFYPVMGETVILASTDSDLTGSGTWSIKLCMPSCHAPGSNSSNHLAGV